jgi:hypothetical protein
LSKLNLKDEVPTEGYGLIDAENTDAVTSAQQTIEYELKDYVNDEQSDKASASQFELLNVLGQVSFAEL